MALKEVLRCCILENGVRFVASSGTWMMRKLSAVSLVMPAHCVRPLGPSSAHPLARYGWTSFDVVGQSLLCPSVVTVAGDRSPATTTMKPALFAQVHVTRLLPWLPLKSYLAHKVST